MDRIGIEHCSYCVAAAAQDIFIATILLFCEARGNDRIFLDHSSNEILSAVRLTVFIIKEACPSNQEGLRCERRLALVHSYIEG